MAYTLKKLKEELKVKQKNVSDIIRYLKNRNDGNPNYSLFLGAGCSKTSGIRLAGELVKEWKKEIFEEYKKTEDKYEDVEQYLSNESWYDRNNEYACLFEKRFDFSGQRRAFVEKEIKIAKSSIGYSYLVRLIEEKFFRTVFTTNFDDLLNESFFKSYSKHRPIVCAHDSSINSVTVTSERPKIIKLHGDYLFEDIKAIPRETESLQKNMEKKFAEFAKDYGLIIIGYAGQDRSIMDSINYLLEIGDYFNNGIYWCIHDADDEQEIPEALRKLIWKDKVHFVLIKGFDEFFAEINSKINDKRNILPYHTKFDDLIKEVKDTIKIELNKFESCEYIKKDLEQCDSEINESVNEANLNILNEDYLGAESRDFEKKERQYINEIVNYFKAKNFDKVIKKIDGLFQEDLRKSFREYLYQVKSVSYSYLLDFDSASKTIIELINWLTDVKYGDIIPHYHYLCSKLEPNPLVALNYINIAINLNPYKYKSYKIKSEILEKLKETIGATKIDDNDIIYNYNKSIELNSSLSNSSYFRKLEFLMEIKSSNEKFNKEFDNTLLTCENLDPFNSDVVEHKLKTFKDSDKRQAVAYLDNIIEKNTNHFREPDYHIEKLELLSLDILNEVDFCNYINDISERYKDSVRLNIEISHVLVEKLFNLNDAILFLEKKIEETSDEESIKMIRAVLISYYVTSRNIPKAKEMLSKFTEYEILNKKILKDSQLEVLLLENKKDELIQKLENTIKVKNDVESYMQYSFFMLRLKEYQVVFDKLKVVNESLHSSNIAIFANYYLAKYKTQGKINSVEKILEKINIEKEDYVRASLYGLLYTITNKEEYKKKCCEYIGKSLIHEYSYYYAFQDFPILKEVFDKEVFKRNPISLKKNDSKKIASNIVDLKSAA